MALLFQKFWEENLFVKSVNALVVGPQVEELFIAASLKKWYLGYKNLLRAVEFAGKSGINGMEYISSNLTQEQLKKILYAPLGVIINLINPQIHFISGG